MGRFGGRTGQAGAVLAGFAEVIRQVRLQSGSSRTFWARLRAQPRELRSGNDGGSEKVARIYGRCDGPVCPVRRIAFGRTWRWTGAGGVPAENVRRGPGTGVSRIQDDLGSRRKNESGGSGRPIQDRRKPAAFRANEKKNGRDALCVRSGQRRLFASGGTMRGGWQVPPRRGARRAGHHVPEFYGDARGKTFHTRASASALGNDARRSVNGWMEERRGEGSAGSLPRLQRMQGRLPSECGRRDIQGGVSVALLAPSHAAPARIRIWLDRQVGDSGGHRATHQIGRAHV